VEGATVLIPDPMGATGGSLCEVLRMYREDVPGPARRLVAMHLIVTPEHIARVTREAPDVQIYAVRVDRGLSAPDVLDTVPGARHAEERGLNDHQYIVPGAGGLGELMNNSWV
jgi:uracil phosphoribosyltransferase